MDKYICKAKVVDSPFDKSPGEWVYGYYVALPDEYTHGEDICHAIFSLDCEHVCMGEYKDYGWHEVDPDTVCRYTGMSEFVVTDKSVNQPLFEGDIVEVHSLRRPYAAWPQSKYDGEVKVRAVIYFERGQWLLDYDNSYNNKMCETRGNEQYERSVDGAWELYYFGYKGKPEHEDEYREHNKLYHRGDIIKLGNIHDNQELLEG